MNIIRTVGDLKKVLHAYNDNKEIIVMVNGVKVLFNSDYQISQRVAEQVVISLNTDEK